MCPQKEGGMKVCSCRDFDCAAAGKAIKEHKPEKAEDVHKLVTGQAPNCGSCLPRVQAMMDAFNKTGQMPCPLELGLKAMQQAEEKLTARYESEAAQGDTALFKRRFFRRKSATIAPGNNSGITSAA